MTIPDHTELKRQLRARMRSTPVDPDRHNPRICALVAQWLEGNPHCRHIAIYHPMADEPDLLPLMDCMPGRIWHFPRIANGEMTFHPISSTATDLTSGVFDIPEPKPSIPATAPHAIDAFLCPGLAFEKSTGSRLGRGKGYYDRYLTHRRHSALLAGAICPERLVDNTYSEPHDVRMHRVFC